LSTQKAVRFAIVPRFDSPFNLFDDPHGVRLIDAHSSVMTRRTGPQFVIVGGIRSDVGLRMFVVLVRARKSAVSDSLGTHGLAMITLKNLAIARE
jgi:hypothetical protein